MHITSSTLRTVAWSALALSTAHAQYVIDNLSFGQKEGESISPNLRAIPHFSIKGDGWDPEILSDRVMLTPPWPGNRRGSIWSEDPLHHKGDWEAQLHFRASGMERGGGNLQLWYTKDSQKDQVPASLHTAPKFDGLVLVIDQYEGRGGSVRGFLNGGNIDIKAHPDPDTLAFGQCTYAYRNLGRLSVISLKQANGVFEVKIDGNPCFSTTKVNLHPDDYHPSYRYRATQVKLPEDYYFGISASSAENPDSFEVHKFLVSTTNAYTREEPVRQPPANQQQNVDQSSQRKQRETPANKDIPQMLDDVFAASLQSQQDQFADLHYRIQIMNHQVNKIYDMLEKLTKDSNERQNSIMGRIVPMHDQVSAVMRNVEKVERTTMETLRDLESKDFKALLNQVHDSIERSHNALGTSMPLAMAGSKYCLVLY